MVILLVFHWIVTDTHISTSTRRTVELVVVGPVDMVHLEAAITTTISHQLEIMEYQKDPWGLAEVRPASSFHL